MSEKKEEQEVQAILFPIQIYSEFEAEKWLRDHNYKALKKHRTEHYIRYRIKNPNLYSRFITKILNNNVHLVLGFK